MKDKAKKENALTDEERVRQLLAEVEKKFLDSLAELGIDFEKHKKAVAKAELACFGAEPVLYTEEDVIEYYKHPAEEILDLSNWADEDILSVFGPLDRDTTINDIIDNMNSEAIELYKKLVKTPEEDWHKIDEAARAEQDRLRKAYLAERLQDYLTEHGTDFETHKKAVAKIESSVLGCLPPVSSADGDLDKYYRRPAYSIFGLSSYDEPAIENMLDNAGLTADGEHTLNDLTAYFQDEAENLYSELIGTAEEKWDGIIRTFRDSLGM